MKHIIFVLMISFLFLTACTSTDVVDDETTPENATAQETEDAQEDDILPGLVDPDDEVEIGDMI